MYFYIFSYFDQTFSTCSAAVLGAFNTDFPKNVTIKYAPLYS